MVKKIFVLFVSFLVASLSAYSNAYALEIEISGNGGESSSEVNTTSESTVKVEQNNKADVQNQAEAESNTGNNQANGNTGEKINVDTGDVNADVSIDNDVNHSNVDIGCCTGGQDTNTVISGNGAGSVNSADETVNKNLTIDVKQAAIITNNIKGSANTGKNIANNNAGIVRIETGNIKVSENIANIGVNSASVKGGAGIGGELNIKIANNGSGSTNSVIYNLGGKSNININNYSDINNNSEWDLNTGGNRAIGGNGKVEIITGDIDIYLNTINEANTSGVEVGCCDDKEIDDPGDPTPPPMPPSTPPPGNNGGNGGSGNSGGGNGDGGNGGVGGTNGGGGGNGDGSVLGSAGWAATVLPHTGAWAWIANIGMFILGLYMRLRAGRAPCFA